MAKKQSDADMLRREPVAKTEDIPQFLKGTPNADEAGFLRTSQPRKKYSIVHYPPHKLSSASKVELIA